MRKCHCTSNTKIKGVFRGFFQEGNLEHGCDPVGLIELEDGTISAPCATSIQFDEPPKEEANDSALHNKSSFQLPSLMDVKKEILDNGTFQYADLVDMTYHIIEKLGNKKR